MVFESWACASWITKVTLYLAVAMVVGGGLSGFLLKSYIDIKDKLLKYILLGACLGVVSSLFGFAVLVGSFSNTGLRGMLNDQYISLLLNTAIGHVHVIRILSFAVITLLMTVVVMRKPSHFYTWQKLLLGLFILPIIYSFSQLGHVVNSTVLAQVLLSVHVLIMSVWLGVLYPLWLTTHKIVGLPLKQCIHLFGVIASFIVAILLLCGISVALMLIQNMDVLLNTPYGYGFMIKMVFVLAILSLAVLNKYYFTPRLQQVNVAKIFGYAILFEMLLGLSILVITGYITTVVGID